MLSEQQLSTLAAAIASETDPEFVALRDSGATGAGPSRVGRSAVAAEI